jgi:hypothetical protein
VDCLQVYDASLPAWRATFRRWLVRRLRAENAWMADMQVSQRRSSTQGRSTRTEPRISNTTCRNDIEHLPAIHTFSGRPSSEVSAGLSAPSRDRSSLAPCRTLSSSYILHDCAAPIFLLRRSSKRKRVRFWGLLLFIFRGEAHRLHIPGSAAYYTSPD